MLIIVAVVWHFALLTWWPGPGSLVRIPPKGVNLSGAVRAAVAPWPWKCGPLTWLTGSRGTGENQPGYLATWLYLFT